MPDFQQQLALQSWILYGIGMVLISLRAFVFPTLTAAFETNNGTRYARWHRVRSLSRFSADDWIMMSAVPLLYTGLIICLNRIAEGGGSNLFPPEQLSTFTQEDIKERIKGSKAVVVSEQVL